MQKTFLIAMQQVRQTALYKPFLASLLLGPLLLWFGALGMNWILQTDMRTNLAQFNHVLQTQVGRGVTAADKIGYVDQANLLRAPSNVTAHAFVPYADVSRAQQATLQKQIGGYYVIPRDFLTHGEIFFYSAERLMDQEKDARFERWVITNLARAENTTNVERIVQPIRTIENETAVPEVMTGL